MIAADFYCGITLHRYHTIHYKKTSTYSIKQGMLPTNTKYFVKKQDFHLSFCNIMITVLKDIKLLMKHTINSANKTAEIQMQ